MLLKVKKSNIHSGDDGSITLRATLVRDKNNQKIKGQSKIMFLTLYI